MAAETTTKIMESAVKTSFLQTDLNSIRLAVRAGAIIAPWLTLTATAASGVPESWQSGPEYYELPGTAPAPV